MSTKRARMQAAAEKAGKKTTRYAGMTPQPHSSHGNPHRAQGARARMIEAADGRLRASTVRLAQALVDDAKARNVAPPADIAEIASKPSKRAWTKKG